jgi:hypothetical protein
MTRPASAEVPGFGVREMLAVVLVVSLARYGHQLLTALIESRFIDFAHYYTYTTVVARGLNPFDPAAVATVEAELGLRRALGAADYSPLFYLGMRPWAALPFPAASLAWFAFVQACLVGTLALLVRAHAPAAALQMAAMLFVVLNFQPLVEDIALGQVNVVLLFLVTASWFVARRRAAPWVAAVPLALAVHTKPQYTLLLPLLWWQGERAVATRGALLAAAGAVLSIVVLGPRQTLDFLHHVFTLPAGFFTWPNNLAISAVFQRLFAGLEPVGIAGGLTFGVNALLLAVVLWVLRPGARSAAASEPARDLGRGLAVVTVPLLSPFTEEHHLVVLLFPLALLLFHADVAAWSRADVALLLAGIVLVATRYSGNRFPALHTGLPSLLIAGKIVGAALLGLVLVRRIRQVSAPAAPAAYR